MVVPVRVPSVCLTELFKEYSYFIGLSVKNPYETTTQKYKYECIINSQTFKHKITLEGVDMPLESMDLV